MIALGLMAPVASAEPAVPTGLEPVSVTRIADKKAGFTEPSGLAPMPSGDGFWSVSDGTGAVFRLTGSGAVTDRIHLGKHSSGLEGVAWDPGRDRLLMVRENSSEILVLDPGDPATVARFALERMEGFRAVATLFRADDNNGLEGITVVPETGTVLVLKENALRLLMELTPDLTSIRGAVLLTAAMGFTAPGVSDAELDVSGLAYDAGRQRLWITSDTGRAVFLFDPAAQMAIGFPLDLSQNTTVDPLDNAEGVAVSADGTRLFVVSDDGGASRLVTYEIR